jgi:hydroxycarboxylate dehydrogenase B
MPTISHQTLLNLGVELFKATGVPADQAQIVADHLVEANLMGHDSHGIRRLPAYVDGLRKGTLRPFDDYTVVRETPTTMVIDARGGLGMVAAYRAMELAVERAKTYTLGAVAVHQSGHIGRLGAFPPLAAAQDCIGIIMLNGGARFTVPFGGTARRLPPNPIAIAVPTASGEPLVLDITTSMVAGGKIDVYYERNLPVPADWLIDANGNPVTDPGSFRRGESAMLPLGGLLGHKGYGLAVMIDAIAGGLSWAGCSAEQPTRGASGFLAMAMRIDGFIDPDEYKREVQCLVDWVKSSPTAPGVDQIYLPGEIENKIRQRRETEGIVLEEVVWEQLSRLALECNVSLPE